MKTELQKIEHLLAEMARLQETHPDLAVSREFFEMWETDFEPRPFSVKGPTLAVADREIRLPAKGAVVIHMAWNHARNAPELTAESGRKQRRFRVRLQPGGVVLEEGPPDAATEATAPFGNIAGENDGEIMEVIHDVIQTILEKTPAAHIFKLKKNGFLQALACLEDRYAPKLLKRASRLPAKQVKALIRQAASDMAIDDLTAQISLPMARSYAMGEALDMEPPPDIQPQGAVLPPRTRWTALQDLAFLLTLARIQYEVQKDFLLPLENAEIVPTGDPGHTVFRLPDAGEIPLYEGSRLTIRAKGDAGRLGTAVVGLMDGDTMFGELFWDTPGEAPILDRLELQPRKAPHQLVLVRLRELHDRVKDDPDAVQGALRYILGLDAADFRAGETAAPKSKMDAQTDAEMDFSQKQSWAAAVDPANPVVAVQGPPGTGKTWLLVRVIRHLCGQGLRLLITAPSNTAVDNICKAITDLPTLRFGNPDKIDGAVLDACWSGNADNVDAYLKKYTPGKTGCVYGATQMRALFDEVIGADFHKRGLFDVVIFDEAGMARMDEFLLCARMGRRVILFGDQRQLPPFPLSKDVLKRLAKEHGPVAGETRKLVELSALEWLAAVRNAPLMMLQRSYRCQNPRLMRFSSLLFYSARVQTSETAEYFRLPYYQRQEKYPRSTLRFYCTSALPESVRKEAVVLDDARIGIENRCEALICRYVLTRALEIYPPEQITVISPYKRQVRRIRSLLDAAAVHAAPPRTVSPEEWQTFLSERIATVDSFQGGESDLVVISYVRSNAGQGVGFVDHPNRINVAHTRCRRELVVIGDLKCLKKQARSDIFIRMERSFHRDGEIIDVDEELYAAMGGNAE